MKKQVFWPLAIALTGLFALMVGCSRDTNQSAAPARTSAPAAPAEHTPPAPPPAKAAEVEAAQITIPAGTSLGVRLDTRVSSDESKIEQPVDATLIRPVMIGKQEVLPAGSRITGDVVAAQKSGNVKGRAHVAIRFTTLKVHGDSYPIVAEVSRIAPATKKRDAEKIAIPAAGGALVGALVGGGKGAAIGAAAGGGAGTAVVLATPGKEVSLPKGSILALKLRKSVAVNALSKS